MKKKVVIENTLEDVRDYFASHGYDVRTMYRNDTLDNITTDEYDAIIVSDINNGNFSQSIHTKSPVIEAAELTPEQIFEKIRGNLKF